MNIITWLNSTEIPTKQISIRRNYRAYGISLFCDTNTEQAAFSKTLKCSEYPNQLLIRRSMVDFVDKGLLAFGKID